MALRELALQVLLDAGFPPPVAVRCYATLARFVLGFAIQLNGQEVSDEALAEAYGDTSQDAFQDAFPATTAVAPFVPVPLHDEFSFGLDLLITGLAQGPWRKTPSAEPPRISHAAPMAHGKRS